MSEGTGSGSGSCATTLVREWMVERQGKSRAFFGKEEDVSVSGSVSLSEFPKMVPRSSSNLAGGPKNTSCSVVTQLSVKTSFIGHKMILQAE